MVACGALLLSNAARAEPNAWPFPPLQPGANGLPQLPAIDVGALLTAVSSCPPVEIAPGVYVPIPCANALPKPPIDAPSIDLSSPALAPLAVDLRARGLDGPVKDQAQTGVCYAFALTTGLEASLRRQGRGDVLSPLHVVAAGAWDDLWRTKPTEAITAESVWPYDPIKACRFEHGSDACERAYGVSTGSWQGDPILVAERARARSMGVAFTGRAQRLKGDVVGSIVAALASGRPVNADIGIDTRSWGWRGVQGGVLPEYERADRGGHAVVLVGYRATPAGRQFLIHNSWGPRWGEGGYAWMSEAGLRKHILEAYLVDATIAGGLAPVPPPAPPGAPPVATLPTCSGGTVLDVGTGKCAPRCRSGLAPLLGQCWLG